MKARAFSALRLLIVSLQPKSEPMPEHVPVDRKLETLTEHRLSRHLPQRKGLPESVNVDDRGQTIGTRGDVDNADLGWHRLVMDNLYTPTDLSKLGTRKTAQLLLHGFALGMATLHTLWDYPLCAIPSLQDFEEFVENPASSVDTFVSLTEVPCEHLRYPSP